CTYFEQLCNNECELFKPMRTGFMKHFATTLTTSFDLEFFTNQGLSRFAKFAQF
ncbi:hypothetical protein Moror_10993, partial [Moniliophthora roreri MCA 2997]